MRHASLALALALPLALLGCGPQFAVIPRGGQTTLEAAAPMGLKITAFAEQWGGDPHDLADYVTPILVELYNPSPYEVRVSLVDFVLKDERGTRYGTINPFTPSALGELTPLRLEKPTLLAARGVGIPGGIRGGGVRISPPSGSRGSFGGFGGARGGFRVSPPPSRYIGPSSPWRSGYGYGGRSWVGGWSGGFYISGGLRGYYGPGALYWTYPWLRPPYYSDWVYYWGPGYYPASPSPDVLGMALPEGVLPPNSRVTGFVYFKRATAAEQRSLDLTWELVEARSSNALGSLHVPLDVVPN